MAGRPELAREMEAFRSRYGVPAVGGALLTEGESPVIEVVGTRRRSIPETVSPQDLWHIGSCAKSMTAALVGRQVEAGAVEWETPVLDLFPDLDPDSGWHKVTLSQLLTHRSGMRANLTISEMRSALKDTGPVTEQRTEAAARALSRPPHRVGRFRYSNLGYTVVGSALERLSGKPYEVQLLDELFQPLGITSAGFGAPLGEQPWGHRSRFLGIGRGPEMDPAETGGFQPSDNPAVMSPAGRLHLSLEDWARFIGVFMASGSDLLRESTVTLLTTPASGRGPRQGMGWAQVPLEGVSLGQQGSNRRWVATALISEDRRRAVLIVCNDGRARLLRATGRWGVGLLTGDDN